MRGESVNPNKRLKLIYAMIVMFASVVHVNALPDHVIINQVLYDPVGSETGGEAIELYNPTSSAVNISGWVVKTASSTTDAVLGNNVILQPARYFLITDAGWGTLKDNTSWPSADHEEPITLANTNSGVALLSGATVVDAVGWGDQTLIASDLYEGTSALPASTGQSLRRVSFSDTNNNSADLIATAPDFHNSNPATNTTSDNKSDSGSNITMIATVTNSPPRIDQVLIGPDDDPLLPGVQVMPFPGQNASVNITATVTDLNEQTTITVVKGSLQPFGRTFVLSKTTALNKTTAQFQGITHLQFFEESLNYSITVNATDDANASSAATLPFQYGLITAIELETTTLNFGALSVGSVASIIGDALFGTTSKPTVRNIGNTKLNLGLKSSGLSSASVSIPSNSIKYSFDGSFSSNVSGMLSTVLSMKPTNVGPGSASYAPLSLELTVPSGTKKGLFSGQLMLVASST